MRYIKRKAYKLLVNPEDTPSNPLTWERLMKWLADTRYVEGLTISKMQDRDMIFKEDYIQEVWVQILSVPPEKMMDIWYKGKGKFVNYIKSIIINNVYSASSYLFKNIRADRFNEVYMDDAEWTSMEEIPDTSAIYLEDGEKIDII